MNEMTTAGDVGSGTGSEPVVRYGQRKGKVQRRKRPYKKIKTFTEFITEIYINNKYKIGDFIRVENHNFSEITDFMPKKDFWFYVGKDVEKSNLTYIREEGITEFKEKQK